MPAIKFKSLQQLADELSFIATEMAKGRFVHGGSLTVLEARDALAALAGEARGYEQAVRTALTSLSFAEASGGANIAVGSIGAGGGRTGPSAVRPAPGVDNRKHAAMLT
jgi:hypothetical protein